MVRRGELVDFDGGSWTATVAMAGSSRNLEDVPVSRALASGEMTAGRAVAVAFFDLANPGDCVVVAVWT